MKINVFVLPFLLFMFVPAENFFAQGRGQYFYGHENIEAAYRGRMTENNSGERKDFYLLEVRSIKSGGGMYLDFVFSDEIDPRRISASQFLIDGNNLSRDTEFKFNKSGSIARVYLDKTEVKELVIDGVYSSSGERVKRIVVRNIHAGENVRVY